MNLQHPTLCSFLVLSFIVTSCGGNQIENEPEPDSALDGSPLWPSLDPSQSCAEDAGVVVPTPEAYPRHKSWGFDRYAEVLAPNGEPIKIFAAPGVADEMVIRARNVLRFFLTDVPGTRFGADKRAVANAMANHGATLMLPSGSHEEGNEPPSRS